MFLEESPITIMIETYMRMVAFDFIEKTFGEIVEGILIDPTSLEVSVTINSKRVRPKYFIYYHTMICNNSKDFENLL